MAKQTSSSGDWKGIMKQLDDKLELYLVKKAPSIPDNWKEILVKITPWLMIVFAIFAIPSLLMVLGINIFALPFSYLGNLRYGTSFSINMLLAAVILVLQLMAIPGLLKRAKKGWNLVYYAVLVGVLQNIVSFSIGGLLIGSLLSLYILYQIKEKYK